MEEGLCQWSVFRSLLAILQWWFFNVTVIIMNKWIFQVCFSDSPCLILCEFFTFLHLWSFFRASDWFCCNSQVILLIDQFILLLYSDLDFWCVYVIMFKLLFLLVLISKFGNSSKAVFVCTEFEIHGISCYIYIYKRGMACSFPLNSRLKALNPYK